ncbi:MAG: tripartite tricarboxylate transporter substrate-binding protein, partial [Nitrososphaerales archaeon]|nr:tripartite tricarboxylate transporter substrate-binding protein [Nitrososphaerales archaeon]
NVHGTWPVLKHADISWTDFYAFLAVQETTAIYVNWDAPWKDLPDLLSAIKANPGKFRYGSPGAGSNGHIFGELVLKQAGLAGQAIHIPYTGGREAGAKVLAGEIEFCSVTFGDLTDYLMANKMRVLAVLHDKDIPVEGYRLSPAPNVVKYFPVMKAYFGVNPSFGIYLPRAVPDDVVRRVAEGFVYTIKQERFLKLIKERNMLLTPRMGIESDKTMSQLESARSWPLWELKIAKVDPATLEIPKPEEWKWPPHSRAEKAKPWPKELAEWKA